MFGLLLNWKFWLAAIIIIIVIRFLVGSTKKDPPPYEDEEQQKDPELAEIAISYIPEIEDPISPEISNDNSIVDEPEIYYEEDPVTPKEVEIEVNLMDNGRSSVGEHLTAQALKVILNGREILRNVRPKFLRNKTGYPMEIDCYCPELKIGVEYNGIGHYQYPNPFHYTEKEFEEQVERDILKRQLADKNGITIFTVPCTIDAVKYNEKKNKYVTVKRTRKERYDLILNYLKEQLKVLNL